MQLDAASNFSFASRASLNTDLHSFQVGRRNLTVIDELQCEGGKVEVSDDFPLAHAEISTSGGTRGESAHTPLLTVFKALGTNRSETRELLSSGGLAPSRNDSGVENTSASKDNALADEPSGSVDDRVVDSHLIKGRKQSRRSSHKLP